ncbi:MAG: hypothetical protein PHQ76_00905 [Caldisericia bacterium]|mgnify:CR=1 FL=1|nr:hypothetical protein [Caldisericia bacterium]MDD3427394.1 hypothetical protein [Caldisericia bacterium]MDD5688821.1 hypothetical protein [Caldisericia bacterium]HOJ15740.1 hypothetical protein [Caldisericia bacterium]HOW02454.1 hypothetical protein [Caldisericia bacterium]
MNGYKVKASYSKWVKEALTTFRTAEKKLTYNEVIILSGEEEYLKEILRLIYFSTQLSQLSYDISLRFARFISFLLKSTLFFDFTFYENLKTLDSKLSLMYGDLYLAQAGIEFANIEGYKKTNNELKRTLKSIAISQKIESNIKPGYLDYKNYKKIINLRYGSIFRLSLITPLIFGEIKNIPKKSINYYSTNVALLVSLKHNKYIKPAIDAKEKSKKMSTIKSNTNKYLGEIINELHFNGWKSNSKKDQARN